MLVPGEPASIPLTVDLEDDIGGRSWRSVPQATNLRMPLSAMDISMTPVESVKVDSMQTAVVEGEVMSPGKKAKKHKHVD